MNLKLTITVLLCFLFFKNTKAQSSDVSSNEVVKKYAPLRIKGTSPSKIISLAYEYNAANTIQSDINSAYKNLFSKENVTLKNNTGLRFSFNLPVVNKDNLFIGFGYSYAYTKFSFDRVNSAHFMHDIGKLQNHKLTLTLYKPFNEKHFILLQYLPEYNSNFQTKIANNLTYVKHSFVAAFGWYFHERKQFGLGLNRSYRAGEMTYFPLILFNFTSPQMKWGTEIAFPARAHLRYNFNSKSLLLLGYELEGASYVISNKNGLYNQPGLQDNLLELRKSEFKCRIIAEKSLYKNIWASAQIGYRINNDFNLDEYDVIRFLNSSKNRAYVSENKLTNNFYAQIGVHFVAP